MEDVRHHLDELEQNLKNTLETEQKNKIMDDVKCELDEFEQNIKNSIENDNKNQPSVSPEELQIQVEKNVIELLDERGYRGYDRTNTLLAIEKLEDDLELMRAAQTVSDAENSAAEEEKSKEKKKKKRKKKGSVWKGNEKEISVVEGSPVPASPDHGDWLDLVEIDAQIEDFRKLTLKFVGRRITVARKELMSYLDTLVDTGATVLGQTTEQFQNDIENVKKVITKKGARIKKVRRDLNNKLDERQAAAVRQLNDLDTRLLSLSAKLAQIEDKLDARVAAPTEVGLGSKETKELEEASAALSENMREKLSSIIQWQELTSQNIKELQRLHQTLPTDIFELNEKLALLKNDTSARIQGEIENRVSDVEKVRRELEKMLAKENDKEATPTMRDMDNEPSQSEIEEVQGSIRKLAESMQTVKTVLGMKIQSEQKLRNEEVKAIQDDLQELRAMIEPILKNSSNTRLFIKPEGDIPRHEAESGAPDVNKWGLYSAVRWLSWKSRWMYVKWKKQHERSTLNSAKDKPPAPETPKHDMETQKTPSPSRSRQSLRDRPEGQSTAAGVKPNNDFMDDW